MIVETTNRLSLYDDFKGRLRVPGDDQSLTPTSPDKQFPDIQKLLQMTLRPEPPISKQQPSPKEYHGGIPGELVLLRLKHRLLCLPPLDPKYRWIWGRPGYITSANRRRARVEGGA